MGVAAKLNAQSKNPEICLTDFDKHCLIRPLWRDSSVGRATD